MTIDELSKATPLTIFLIEDDDGDAKAVKRAFSKEQISIKQRLFCKFGLTSSSVG